MTLSELYETYEAQLRRYANRLTRDADWADDLVQDTMVRSMGHLELLGLLEPQQRRAWLYRTLKNLFIDQERSRRRREALVERLAGEIPVESYRAGEVIASNPFDLVPERFRDVVEMRFILGMNSREIGEELGIPAATVRSRIHLAMKALRAHFGNRPEGG
jgi:RNA polymerase sigma-70 factor (ECF subfamily)